MDILENDFIAGGGIAAIVLAVVQGIKSSIPKKYRPASALILGILLGGGLMWARGDSFGVALMKGITIGLVAIGTYDQKAIAS